MAENFQAITYKSLNLKKSPIYPLHLGGVWMVGVRGYIGPKTAMSYNFPSPPLAKRGIACR